MENINASEFIDKFRSQSFDPPPEYVWAIKHKMLGFEEFSQFEPWHFCGIPKIIPLSIRWPSFQSDHEYIPFARRQDMDDLACFEYKQGEAIAVCVIHYDLGPPVSWEICERYKTFWDWMKGTIDDVEMWFRIVNRRNECENH